MKFDETTPVGAEARNLPGDDLDRLLSAFYKAELPEPWPHMRAPESETPATLPLAAPAVAVARRTETPRRMASIGRSRFALAASVALLLGGCWYLSDRLGNGPTAAGPAPMLGGPEATLDHLHGTVNKKNSPSSNPVAPSGPTNRP